MNVKNPFRDEIHAVREKTAADCDYDLCRIVEHLKVYARAKNLKVVSLAKNPPRKKTKAA